MFSKKPAQPAIAPARKPVAGSSFSVLGPDTVITGDISASADLHVDGRVEGDISCQSFVQGDTGEIAGSVRAETARIAGTVRGSISARELVILRSARIEGDVSYEALTIEQGAQVEGRLTPRGSADAADAGAPRAEPHLALAGAAPAP